LSGFLMGRRCGHRLFCWGERNQRHSDESKHGNRDEELAALAGVLVGKGGHHRAVSKT